MTFQCPSCRSEIHPQAVRVERGTFGAVSCPKCNARLRPWPPYLTIVFFGTLPILCLVLATRGIQEGWFFSIRAALLWFISTILVSVLLSRIKPPWFRLDRSIDKDAPHFPVRQASVRSLATIVPLEEALTPD